MATINYAGKFCLCLLLCLFCAAAGAQLSRLDSLKRNITSAVSEDRLLQATLAFCEEWESFSPDTLYKYALYAREEAKLRKDKNAVLLSEYYLAAYLFQENRLDSALTAIDTVIAHGKRISEYNDVLVKSWMLRGNVLLRTSHYDELLRQNYALLILAERQRDTVSLIRTNTSVGNVNMRLKKYTEALDWHRRALALMRNDNIKANCSFVYLNISIVYYHLAVLNDNDENKDSIMANMQRAIYYSRQGKSLTNLASSLSAYGHALAEYGDIKPAEKALTEALEIRKKIGDIFYELIDMVALSSFYEHSDNHAKALKTLLQALDLANKNRTDFTSRSSIYSLLGELYSRAGNFEKYSEVLKASMQLQDSFYKVNSAEVITELETKYEVQKKENIIIQQKYDLAKMNFQVYGFLLLLLIVSVFSFILFKQQRKKQKLKMQMLQEEEQRMSAIAVAAAEESERQRIAAELHDNLGSQLSYVSSNVDFILDTPVILPEEEKQKRLGRVKETVKNAIADLRGTIWALKKESVRIEEIADKLKLHAQNQLSHKTDMKLDVQESLAVELILSPAEALNVFRIFQEAINNAIKYSCAETIQLSVETGPSSFRIAVSDNGMGFDTQKTYTDHYGLENMKERAKEIKAVLEVCSEPGKGSSVILSRAWVDAS